MTLNCNGKLLDLASPKVMGILNVTPDSFFDGHKDNALIDNILVKTEAMILEGAAVIDVGAISTRPGADLLSEGEELFRLKNIIPTLLKSFPDTIFSIDTFRSSVARQMLDYGIHMVNDVFANEFDGQMFTTMTKFNAAYIMMHCQGKPENMQQNPTYNDVTLDILQYFAKKIHTVKALGLTEFAIDPGFGFGKTLSHNYQLLQQLEAFQIFDVPVVVGLSRKGMIYKPLGISADEALNGTSVAHTIALTHKANILRVHDVKAAVECITILSNMNQNNLK